MKFKQKQDEEEEIDDDDFYNNDNEKLKKFEEALIKKIRPKKKIDAYFTEISEEQLNNNFTMWRVNENTCPMCQKYYYGYIEDKNGCYDDFPSEMFLILIPRVSCNPLGIEYKRHYLCGKKCFKDFKKLYEKNFGKLIERK